MIDEAQAKREERLRRFVEILSKGGTLVIHPDTFNELRSTTPASMSDLWLQSYICKVVTNRYVEKGQMFAVEKQKPYTWPDFDLESWGVVS